MLRTSQWSLRWRFCFAGVFAAIVLPGCNTCFVAFSNNGNGGVIIKSGNPPPACTVPQSMGKMSVTAHKAGECVNCAPGARIEHVFVTLQSIRIRPDAPANGDSADWIELAPAFAKQPHQLDLAGESLSDALVKNATLPVGTYRELEMKLFSVQPEGALSLPTENACGEGLWNCIMTNDGRIKPLYGPGNSPEVVVPFEVRDGAVLVVLADSSVDVQVDWKPQIALASDAAGLRVQNILVGTVEVRKQSPVEAESFAPK